MPLSALLPTKVLFPVPSVVGNITGGLPMLGLIIRYSRPRGENRQMTYKGFEYSIVQTACPTGWRWTVQLDIERIKTGISYSKGNAIFQAVRAIDQLGLRQVSPAAVE